MENTGKQIRAMRIKRGWTQKELCKICKIQQPVLSLYEKDDYESHTMTMLKKIADAFDMEPEISFISTKKGE